MPDAPLMATRGPWVGGYTSSVPPFMARPDQLVGATDGSDTNSSRDCFIDPFTGGVSKRPGSAIVGDTVDGSGVEVSGIYNTNLGVKTRQLFALDSPSLDDGYPTVASLWGLDTNAGFPAADVGFPASVYVRSTNAGAIASGEAARNYSLLEEFADGVTYSSSPSGAPSAATYRVKVVPVWMESGDGVYMRGAVGAHQAFMFAGSRNVLQTQNWIYAPSLRATPSRWNKRFSETSAIGTSTVRIFPTGPFPPLWPPQKDTLPSATNGSSWVDGDTYYISVMFQFEDGSYSLPFIPRPIQASGLTSGLGLITVGTIGGTNKYPYVPYKNIPLGPEGTVARILLRTPKQNRAAATDTVTVSPLDLRIIGVLRNNTQTDYNDYGGDDDSLLEDTDVVRFDYVCPRRARYIGTGDQRVLISYTLPNTAAILLAPCGINAAYDRNHADTNDNCYGSSGSYVRITSTQLELHYNAGAAPDFVAPGNAIAFSFATYTTLETLVDAINATVSGDLGRQWAAQLAPGIDGSMPSASLTLTTMDIASNTNTSTPRTLTSSALFGPVGIGMKVTGTGIAAGSYVVSKQSNSSITISANTTATGAATLTFYQDTGDNGFVTGGTVGYLRAFSGTYPLLLHMKPSAFPGYATPDKTSLYFTVSSPGAATSGISLAPNSWVAGNRRLPHASPRQQHARVCMGITDIEGAAIVAFNDGVHLFANRRGANSGEDFDYRLFTVNDTRGVVSPLALTSGNGWAAYCTSEGIVCVDKNLREFMLSGDIHNPTDGKGDLSGAIRSSMAAAAKDADDYAISMGVFGSRLVVCYTTVAGDSAQVLYYDFSPGVEASGVEELLNPETKRAYIWSPPAAYLGSVLALYGPAAIGSIVNASGRLDYIAFDTNAASFDGRIEQVGTGTTDDGFSITSSAVMTPFVASEFKRLSPQRCEVTHLRTDGTGGTSVVEFANDQEPTFNASLQRALPSDATKTQFQKQTIAIDQGQRGVTDLFWARWRNSIANSENRIWRLVLQYDETEQP